MGLTYAFNELLSCLVTGLSTALFIWWFAKLGMFPIIYMASIEDMPKEEEEDEQ